MHRTLKVTAAAVAGLAVALVAGLAVAKSFTLKVARNVHVINTSLPASLRAKAVDTHEAVAVGPKGYAVYTFQGETTHHLICKRTSDAATDCWAFWPPVTVRSAKALSAQKGIKGKLATFKNHGLRQLTLGGRPLYYFTPDLASKNKQQAMGDELKTFGSTWHIVKAGSSSKSGNAGSTSSTTMPTTTTVPYGY
jgi:predicted lipoprotein with Yx(FWY)xxD motif